MRKLSKTMLVLVLAVAVVFSISCTAKPKEPVTGYGGLNLPSSLSYGAHGVGSSVHAMATGTGEAIKTMTGMDVRILPLPSDTEKVAGLKGGSADIVIWAISSAYFPIMGEALFKDMGPQDMRMVWHGNGWYLGLAGRGDSGFEEIKDLRGQRVTHPSGSPGFMLAHTAFLAFGGLTFDDVTQVPVSGYAAGWEALISGQADACYAGTGAPKASELEASRHGLHFFPLSPDDKEGWERIWEIGPFYKQVSADVGAGVSKENPIPMAQASVLITALPTLSDDVAFAIAKVLSEEKAKYVDALPVELNKWSLEGATTDLPTTMPYHPGSIKYFEEVGAWTGDSKKWQKEMLKQNDARLGR